jgi:salicylate hydroxylase
MAVEDGAILGLLLTKLQSKGVPSKQQEKNERLTSLLSMYEGLRKKRTEVNVAGAVDARHYFHLEDGDEQKKRDVKLADLPGQNWKGPCFFNWGDAEYQKDLLGFDVRADAEEKFDDWSKGESWM